MLLDHGSTSLLLRQDAILKDFSFELEQGKCLCVLGRNGVGKTTLMRTIMGLTDAPSATSASTAQDITAAPTYERAKLGIGYVPQGRGILAEFTVRENLLGTFARPDGGREIPEICLRLFPYLKQSSTGAPALCPAARSSSSRSPARSRSIRRCCCSTSRPKASSPTSSTRSAT